MLTRASFRVNLTRFASVAFDQDQVTIGTLFGFNLTRMFLECSIVLSHSNYNNEVLIDPLKFKSAATYCILHLTALTASN